MHRRLSARPAASEIAVPAAADIFGRSLCSCLSHRARCLAKLPAVGESLPRVLPHRACLPPTARDSEAPYRCPLAIAEVLMTRMRSATRTASGSGRGSRRRPRSDSVLPISHTAKSPDELIQQGLLKRLQELERLVGAETLRRAELTREEMHVIAGRLDAALEGVSGVSPRDCRRPLRTAAF